MSIKKDELLKILKTNPEYQLEFTDEIDNNLNILLEAVNKFRDAYGIPMIVTSGWRPKAYNKSIGGATNSNHCKGLAVDFSDSDKLLAKYCHDNEKLLNDCGIYCEDTDSTTNWVHMQCVAPKSGKRFFKP